jgi:hypothetical protein
MDNLIKNLILSVVIGVELYIIYLMVSLLADGYTN